MAIQAETVATAFIAAVRQLHAEVPDEAERWQRIAALLPDLLAEPRLRAQAADWPDCNQGAAGGRAENLLFYEDPDYGFVINGLIKASHRRTVIHDHAQLWTAYGVLDGQETIERYERIDDGSREGYAEVRQTANFGVGPGAVDLVPPWQIHAEESGDERTVALIVRSGKPGDFLQNRFDPAERRTWQGYGPVQIPYPLS
jgi:predicted metal-dependent enzyme (double-stranded beta helix superfamily)